ncbi:MAG: LeuD/DmdB family oxidoreductase small subunit [Candidatus Hodarchaeales archaeon]|jgi:3-isopropylmalate/(R)-2-methylmalate dehydratase small subunit
MKKSIILEGKAIIIKDNSGKQIDDIDTDMIFHNKHLHITNINEMGQYAFGNLQGWETFTKMAESGDILIVGKNFGAGSSRQQAVDCFRALGIQMIIGESFGAIYKRNAINSGMPLVIAPDIMTENIKSGDIIKLNLETGEIYNISKNQPLKEANPFSKVQLDIYYAGTLFEYGRTIT